MDFIDRLKGLADRVLKMKEQVQTEEATKNAFIMPFISALGYDVFNPMEVVPEFTADIGLKKGEKVDYCILKNEEPIIIIECKHWKENLDVHNSQLHRYFHATKTRFAILSNGIVYRFYADLETENKMDDKPFLELSLESLNENLVMELKKFQKDLFDVEQILSTASGLKYSKHIKELLAKELKTPSDEFVKFFASQVYTGRITQKVHEQFKDLVQKSAKHLISEIISERLSKVIDSENTPTKESEEQPVPQTEIQQEKVEESKNGIVTTEEELQGFRVVQAILGSHIDLERVTHRDTKSYFGILLDDNNRKPIVRLHFNGNTKSIGVFDKDKKQTRVKIDKVEDIYNHSDEIISRAKSYDAE